MKISILITVGFVLGTFKFMFAHWATFGALHKAEVIYNEFEIFVAVTLGAWTCMGAFYFFSEWIIKRSKAKRIEAQKAAIAAGKMPKRIFTRTNKFIIKTKRKVGIYGLTFLAPLFLSIPLGAIVCAKFFGNKKITFPLMLLSTGLYSAGQCTLIHFLK